jgi:arylformamidase
MSEHHMKPRRSRSYSSPNADRWAFDLIDLTRVLNEETAIGLCGDIVADEANRHYAEVVVTYDREWSTSNGRVCHISMPDHIGTHIDAPIHSCRGGVSLEHVDIARVIGEAVCVDLYRGDVDYGYTAEDFHEVTPRIEHGDIVLIYSGFRGVSRGERIRQTYLTPGAAEWLVERGVRAVGCEPAGIEHGPDGLFKHRWYDKDSSDLPSWPAHQMLLSHDVYIVEGLTNLDRIKGRRVRFAALPLPIPGASGCPVRAVAWIER